MTEADLTRLVQRVIQEQNQIGSVTDTISKTDSESWFSNFPCLNEVPQSKRPMVNGNIILKTYTEPFTLLPESGKGDSQYSFAIKQGVVNRYVGQIKGGGVYYCSSSPSAKKFGPQIAKLK